MSLGFSVEAAEAVPAPAKVASSASDCALVVTVSFVRDGATRVQGIKAGQIVDRPVVSKFDCASGEGVRTSNKTAASGAIASETDRSTSAAAGTQGFAYLGPRDNYFASDSNGRFSAQLTATTPSRPVLAFGYKLSGQRQLAAVSPVTAYVDSADTKTRPCHYGKVAPAYYQFHWSCLTKGGAKGYLHGTFKYRMSVGTATINITFTAYMSSWPGN